MATNTETVGEVAIKYEPLRFCGASLDSVLVAHAYRKYVRINPNSISQVSGHGGTSKYAQWKLHAMSKNIFKLQNLQSGKYLRIIKGGKTVDVGGTGGKFTLFKAVQHNPSSNNMIQPHQIQLESIQFPAFFLAVNGKCNVYSFNANNYDNNANKNDINLYLYVRPQINNNCEEKQEEKSLNVLKPGIVVIQHALNKHLRVQPGNEINANGDGGRGKFARWELEIHGFNLVKFKSTKSGNYLRIINNGKVCNVGGGGGIYTLFKYDPLAKTLESNKFPGFYLAMKKHNTSNVFAVCKDMQNNGDYLYEFNIIHLDLPAKKFNKNNDNMAMVVVQHAFGKSLRVKPGNEGEINGNGGRGKFARWLIEYFENQSKIKLKSNKSGRYLRIIQDGTVVNVGGTGGKFTLFKWNKNEQTLESNNFPGVFLAVNQMNNTVQCVQPQSVINNMNISMRFDIIRLDHAHVSHNKMKNVFNSKYRFSNGFGGVSTAVVVVRSESNGKSLRVKPGNVQLSNCLGGCGGFARWKISNHGGNIYKLQSTNSQKFIRISPNDNGSEVDVRGSGGKYTQWRIHSVRDENVVLFESVVFANKYLASDHKGNVYVAYDNNMMVNKVSKDCMFGVWMKQVGGNNNNDDGGVIKNQQALIEQQKLFIDQLQRTVASQQQIINNLTGGNNNNHGYGQQNMYPVLQSNVNQNDNGTQTNGGEYDDFEYVSNPGSTKK